MLRAHESHEVLQLFPLVVSSPPLEPFALPLFGESLHEPFAMHPLQTRRIEWCSVAAEIAVAVPVACSFVAGSAKILAAQIGIGAGPEEVVATGAREAVAVAVEVVEIVEIVVVVKVVKVVKVVVALAAAVVVLFVVGFAAEEVVKAEAAELGALVVVVVEVEPARVAEAAVELLSAPLVRLLGEAVAEVAEEAQIEAEVRS